MDKDKDDPALVRQAQHEAWNSALSAGRAQYPAAPVGRPRTQREVEPNSAAKQREPAE